MGLDAYIRKISKAKQARYPNTPLWRIPGYYSVASEIIYWRSNREMNRWMLGIGKERHGIDSEAVMNGTPIPLDEQDLLGLKVELMFGSTLREYWENYYSTLHYSTGDVQSAVDSEVRAIDHLIRVVRRGKSDVFYIASW
jgi:hypothetical protein